MKKFDYLVVGSGLYGAIFAHEAKAHSALVQHDMYGDSEK